MVQIGVKEFWCSYQTHAFALDEQHSGPVELREKVA